MRYNNPMKISFLGIPGSFSYQAAREYFSEQDAYEGHPRFAEIFEDILKERVDYGIIPVENSLTGSIYENYDLLYRYDVRVFGEHYLKVEHNLMAIVSGDDPKERISSITRAFSHPRALEQCAHFFEKHPHIQATAYTDTAAAAQYVAQSGDTHMAAVANREASRLYDLQILAANIEDDPHNYTRFLVIGRDKDFDRESNKCSVLFTLPHVPGSLFRTLKYLADHNLNLTKIESRPIPGKAFEYIFSVDFEFKTGDMARIDEAITDFRKTTHTLKVLGFYRAGTL